MNDNDINLSGFTLFDNSKMTRVVDKITLTTGSQFNFPAAFYTVNSLAGTKSARVLYNKSEKRIAITFSEVEDPKGFKFILSNDGKYGGYIAAKSFVTLNKIDLSIYSGRYDYEKIKTDDGATYFIINLSDKNKKEVDSM